MTDNLEIWNKVCRPPATALKQIKGGRLSGMTDISPQWRYKAMTEVFGPCGSGWSYEIVKTWTDQGPAGELMVFAHVHLNVKGYTYPIPGVGGSALIAKETAGLRANDEAYKMAITDALSVAMKQLGVGADIYMGMWDGTKYKNAKDEPVKITPEEVYGTRVNNAAAWFKTRIDEDSIDETHEKVQHAYKNLSNNERLAVDELLQDKAPNSNKAYKSLLKEYLAYKPVVSTFT